jgi:DNA-binding MarR family transcriptional regulator
MTKAHEFKPEMAQLFFDFFVIEKALANVFDSVYAEQQVTTKQWLVLAVASNIEDPSISTIAKILSTSHQNVKVIAQNLEKNGFVELVPSKSDKRTTVVRTTEKLDRLNEARGNRDNDNLVLLFDEFDQTELNNLLGYLERFKLHLEKVKGELT